MAAILVTCKSCNTQVSVTSSALKHRRSECKDVTDITTRPQLATDHGFPLRKLASKIMKDRKTLKRPYADPLNYVQHPTTAGFVPGIRSNKRALLCGGTYNSRKYMLKGTVNDVMKMNDFLTDSFSFPNDCLRVLTGN